MMKEGMNREKNKKRESRGRNRVRTCVPRIVYNIYCQNLMCSTRIVSACLFQDIELNLQPLHYAAIGGIAEKVLGTAYNTFILAQ